MKKILLLALVGVCAMTSIDALAMRKATVAKMPQNKVEAKSRAQSSLSHTVIFEIPEGETKQYSSSYEGVGLDWETISYLPTSNSGFATEVTFCDNDEVYFKNVFAIMEIPMYTYLKGKKVGDKIIVPNMSCIGGFDDSDYDDDFDDFDDYDFAPSSRSEDDEWTFGPEGTYLYLAVMKEDEESDEDINFVIDPTVTEFSFVINADGTIVLDLPEGRYLGECYETGEWLGYSMNKDILMPFTATTMDELPEGLTPERWVLSGAADARFVDVAINGDEIYIGGFTSDQPGYIKGSIDGVKATIPSNPDFVIASP